MSPRSASAIKQEFQKRGNVLIGELLKASLLPEIKREIQGLTTGSEERSWCGLDKSSDLLFDLARSPVLRDLAETLLDKPVVPLRVDFQRVGAGCRHVCQDHREYFPHFDLEPAIAVYLFLDENSQIRDTRAFDFLSNPANTLMPELHCSVCRRKVAVPTVSSFQSLCVPLSGSVACHSFALYRVATPHGSYRPALVFRYRGSPYRQQLTRDQG